MLTHIYLNEQKTNLILKLWVFSLYNKYIKEDTVISKLANYLSQNNSYIYTCREHVLFVKHLPSQANRDTFIIIPVYMYTFIHKDTLTISLCRYIVIQSCMQLYPAWIESFNFDENDFVLCWLYFITKLTDWKTLETVSYLHVLYVFNNTWILISLYTSGKTLWHWWCIHTMLIHYVILWFILYIPM